MGLMRLKRETFFIKNTSVQQLGYKIYSMS